MTMISILKNTFPLSYSSSRSATFQMLCLVVNNLHLTNTYGNHHQSHVTAKSQVVSSFTVTASELAICAQTHVNAQIVRTEFQANQEKSYWLLWKQRWTFNHLRTVQPTLLQVVDAGVKSQAVLKTIASVFKEGYHAPLVVHVVQIARITK